MPRPRVYTSERVQTMLRLPRGLHARLRQDAARQRMSLNHLITEILERSTRE